jgi:predicted RNA-binding Zn ribbon-like protein
MILTALAPGERDDLALAVDLANTWETLDPPSERLTLRSLRRLLEHHGHRAAARAARERDVLDLRAVRDELRRAFEAPSEARSIAILNQQLAGRPAPTLRRAPGGWRFGWDERSPAFVAPAAATALLDALRVGGFGRFGRCAGAPCTGVFVDRSRNRSRRFCCGFCADRSHQRASRARRGRSSSLGR